MNKLSTSRKLVLQQQHQTFVQELSSITAYMYIGKPTTYRAAQQIASYTNGQGQKTTQQIPQLIINHNVRRMQNQNISTYPEKNVQEPRARSSAVADTVQHFIPFTSFYTQKAISCHIKNFLRFRKNFIFVFYDDREHNEQKFELGKTIQISIR